MNQIQTLERRLRSSVPDIWTSLDEPMDSKGPWFLDVKAGDRGVTVEWRPYKGFGISVGGDHGFGEGPVEVVSRFEEALDRVASHLSGESIEPERRRYSLAQLRKFLRMDQSELARRIHMTQAALSKIERRPGRSQIVTLMKFLEGLGAKLEFTAIVPDRGSFKLELEALGDEENAEG